MEITFSLPCYHSTYFITQWLWVITVTEKANLRSKFILIRLCNAAADASLFKDKLALAKNFNEGPDLDATLEWNQRLERRQIRTKNKTRKRQKKRLTGKAKTFHFVRHALLSTTVP